MKAPTLLAAAVGILTAAFFCAAYLVTGVTEGSDHADTPSLSAIPRNDAKITDLYAFIEDDSLVVALCVDPSIPNSVSEYAFQSDAMFEINIDNSSQISYEDANATSSLGGTVLDPGRINADIAFRFTFEKGTPQLKVRGIKNGEAVTQFFAGLRDDPFIRGPRQGRNVAALVIKVPLAEILGSKPDILVWAYSRIPQLDKPTADHGGMALRSMFPENMQMNEMHPRHHSKRMGKEPDVIILNTDLTVGYPNGRLLQDDVVDLVGDQRVLGNDAPFPATNDLPFLTDFPYLSPPHPAP